MAGETRTENQKITADTIIDDVVKNHPRAFELLVKKGVDCCCGAFKTVAEGARDAGLNVEDLLGELNAVSS